MIPKKWNAAALLFSGRQNPEWKLSPVQQKKWMVLWQHAPLNHTEVETPSLLGYTGCRLHYNEHSHWQLYNGCVSFYEHGNIFSKKDEGRQMEFFILQTAPEEVLKILKQQNIL